MWWRKKKEGKGRRKGETERRREKPVVTEIMTVLQGELEGYQKDCVRAGEYLHFGWCLCRHIHS